MPNWCYNILKVRGKEKDLNNFEKFAKSKERLIDANNFIPYPEEFRRLDEEARKHKLEVHGTEDYWGPCCPKDGYNQGGYEWCVANWGVKWNLREVELIKRGKTYIKYGFMTPWNPPVPLIQKMAEMFPQLEFELKYEEPGMQLKGTVNFSRDDFEEDYEGLGPSGNSLESSVRDHMKTGFMNPGR